MNSTDLNFFSAVALSGGIGRAAAELNTVQSNVTQRIQALERQLGVKLFDRTGKGATLTAVGRRLAPYAARVAELLNEAQQAVSEQAEPTGEVRLGCLETTAAMRLPAILKAYASACPKVDLNVETGPTQWLVDRVLSRNLDGAFVTGPVKHAALAVTPIIAEELVFIAPPSVTTRKHFLNLFAAGSTRALVFRAGCSYRQRTTEILTRLGCVDIRFMEMGTLDGIVGCVSGGIGVALLPRAVVTAAVERGAVCLHEVAGRARAAETVFVRRREAFESRALRKFIETARVTAASEAMREASTNRRVDIRTNKGHRVAAE